MFVTITSHEERHKNVQLNKKIKKTLSILIKLPVSVVKVQAQSIDGYSFYKEKTGNLYSPL